MSLLEVLLVFLALGSGLIVGWWSYRRLPIHLTAFQRGLLILLRGFVVAALIWLLTEPLLRRTRSTLQKPLLILLADDSESIFWGKVLSPQLYQEKLEDLARTLESKGYAVEKCRFDTRVHPWGSFSGKGAGTALYEVLAGVRQAFPGAEGIILFSDGVDNSSSALAGTLGLPVWAVGVGPATPATDAAIGQVIFPPWWEARRRHEVEVRFTRLSRPATLIVQSPASTRSWIVPAESLTFRVPLTFPEPGFFPITFRLEVPDDPNPANNTYTAVLTVRPANPHIAIWAGEITPDIAFLRRSLERIGPVTLLLARRPTGFTISPETLSWKNYAIHVLYNFPLRAEDTVYLRRIVEGVGVPWVVWGASVSEALVKPYFGRLGWQALGPLRSYPLSKETALLLRTEYISPAAEKISGPGGIWAYRFVRGNRAAVGLPGEGWWQLRTSPAWTAFWDSLITELTTWSLLFYRSPALFLPQRTRYTLSEPIIWTGQAAPEARLIIRRPSGQLDSLNAVSPLTYQPSESGLYTYILREGQEKRHEGAFWVEAASPEAQRPGIDTLTLRLIASQNKGAYLPWDSLPALPSLIESTIAPQTLVHLQTEILPLHEWWPWLALLLALLSAEWLLRRYSGLY